MRSLNLGRRGKRALAGLAVAVAVPAAVLGSTAAAQADEWNDWGTTYCDDGDAGGCSAGSFLMQGEAGYGANFYAYGERLTLKDNWSDGEPVVGVLWVEGNGTAVYTGEDEWNLSFDEGLDFTVQVCIGSASGTCGPAQGGTT